MYLYLNQIRPIFNEFHNQFIQNKEQEKPVYQVQKINN